MSVIVDGVGLNITVMSYRDHLDFGIVADRDQVDDAWSMLDGLRHALSEFQQVAGTAAKPAAKPKRPRARAKSSAG